MYLLNFPWNMDLWGSRFNKPHALSIRKLVGSCGGTTQDSLMVTKINLESLN